MFHAAGFASAFTFIAHGLTYITLPTFDVSNLCRNIKVILFSFILFWLFVFLWLSEYSFVIAGIPSKIFGIAPTCECIFGKIQ